MSFMNAVSSANQIIQIIVGIIVISLCFISQKKSSKKKKKALRNTNNLKPNLLIW